MAVDQAHVSVPSVPHPSGAPQSMPVTDNTDGAVASFFGGSSTGTPVQRLQKNSIISWRKSQNNVNKISDTRDLS